MISRKGNIDISECMLDLYYQKTGYIVATVKSKKPGQLFVQCSPNYGHSPNLNVQTVAILIIVWALYFILQQQIFDIGDMFVKHRRVVNSKYSNISTWNYTTILCIKIYSRIVACWEQLPVYCTRISNIYCINNIILYILIR